MPCCYVCTVKLDTESTQVCSSITPHSDTPFAQKIAEMLGEEFVAIVTPADQVCPKCTSLLIHLDKVETEGKLIQKLMLSKVQKKYGMLPPDQAIQDVEIANGHLVTKEQLNQGQHKVPNGWTEGVSSTATTTAVVTPIKTPLKLFKTQQLLEEQQQQQLQQQKQQQQKFNDKAKIYQCGICEFQSKDLSTVRLHMNIHKNKKALESPIINEATATSLTLKPKQKKQLYRCQVCSYTYNTRNKCIEHIQKEHKKPTTSNSNEATETEGNATVKEGRKTENAGDAKETENYQEDTTAKEVKPEQKPEPVQQEVDAAMPEQEKSDQETLKSVKKEFGKDNANVES